MFFEEALLKKDSIRVKISVEEVTYLRKNNLQKYAEIKDHLYCPECERPHLTHKLCADRANYFATHIGEEHDDDCSFKCEKASTKQLEALEDDDNSLDRLQNRLKAALVSLFGNKKPKRNPLVIKEEVAENEPNYNIGFCSVIKNYAIPKKRITNGLSEADVDTLKIFYGQVNVRCKKFRNGYKLYLFSCFNNQLPMICSIYLSQKVFNHIDVNDGDYFKCYIAFFAKLESNLYKGQTYYKCVLTDSRKMIFIKIPN